MRAHAVTVFTVFKPCHPSLLCMSTHLVMAEEHLLQLYGTCASLYAHADLHVTECVCLRVFATRGCARLPPVRWLAEYRCIATGDGWQLSSVAEFETQGIERERHGDRSRDRERDRTKACKRNKWVRMCLSVFEHSWPTYTAGYGAVPLCQGVGNCQTFNGARSLQHITWTALKADHSANSKVVSHTAPVPGLRDGAALGGTGPWHGFAETEWKAGWFLSSYL